MVAEVVGLESATANRSLAVAVVPAVNRATPSSWVTLNVLVLPTVKLNLINDVCAKPPWLIVVAEHAAPQGLMVSAGLSVARKAPTVGVPLSRLKLIPPAAVLGGVEMRSAAVNHGLVAGSACWLALVMVAPGVSAFQIVKVSNVVTGVAFAVPMVVTRPTTADTRSKRFIGPLCLRQLEGYADSW